MNVHGMLKSLAPFEGSYQSCMLGVFEGDLEWIVPLKSWNRRIPQDSIVLYQGNLPRESSNSNSLWLYVKDFHVLPFEPSDDQSLLFTLMAHDTFVPDESLHSETWHGQDLRMFGNFRTRFCIRTNDRRPIPNVGIKTAMCGKVIGVVDDKFRAEVSSFNICPKGSTAGATATASPIKKLISVYHKINWLQSNSRLLSGEWFLFVFPIRFREYMIFW